VVARRKEAERNRLSAERNARRQAKLPPASPLVIRCAHCKRTFTGAAAREEFKAHPCLTRTTKGRGVAGQQSGSKRAERSYAAIADKPARAQKRL
jgi:hypothetical protein